jgi:hypothetical protein
LERRNEVENVHVHASKTKESLQFIGPTFQGFSLNIYYYHCSYFEDCDVAAAAVVDDDGDDEAVDVAIGFAAVADDGDAEEADVD